MQSRKFQRGQSALQLLILVSVGGFFLTCILKLGPYYLDNNVVSNALNSLKNDADRLGQSSNREIKKAIAARLKVNNIRGKAAEAVVINRDKRTITISANYEDRIPFLANIDVVLKFENSVEIDVIEKKL